MTRRLFQVGEKTLIFKFSGSDLDRGGSLSSPSTKNWYSLLDGCRTGSNPAWRWEIDGGAILMPTRIAGINRTVPGLSPVGPRHAYPPPRLIAFIRPPSFYHPNWPASTTQMTGRIPPRQAGQPAARHHFKRLPAAPNSLGTVCQQWYLSRTALISRMWPVPISSQQQPGRPWQLRPPPPNSHRCRPALRHPAASGNCCMDRRQPFCGAYLGLAPQSAYKSM